MAGALSHYQAALGILQALPAPEDDDFKTPRLIGIVQERLGTMFEQADDTAAAQEHYAASRAIRLQLAERHPDNTDVVRDAGVADEKMANVMTLAGDPAGALESRQRSLAIFRRLAEADPKNVSAQRSLAISYMHLAELLGGPPEPNLGQREDALRNYEQALAILARQADAGDAKTRATSDAIRDAMRKLRSE